MSSHNHPANDRLSAYLQKRKDENALRALTVKSDLIDFSSNDYLGFSRSVELAGSIQKFIDESKTTANGSTGSRLLSGNSHFAEELEKHIASYHNAEAALIFNSGYDANVGLLSCIARKGDTVIYDELVHASMHDGIRLNHADVFKFRHNDAAHLEERLKAAAGTVFVAVESLYSMDGDAAPLREIARLCEQYHASLIVDEAHATGVIGEKGRGQVCSLGLEEKVFARVHTFGKGLGVHGAAVLGNRILREYLINFSRAFIYTTALPFHSLAGIRCAYDLLDHSDAEMNKLHDLIKLFKARIGGKASLMESHSPVQCVIVPGNNEVKQVSAALQEAGFDVRPILSPTVPRGVERLRICIHAFNTGQEVTDLADAIIKITSGLSNSTKLNTLATGT
jgi:8-amino-7-oxononanoate synthase